jgi:NADH-dependent peroxiredoxin subunit C
MVRVGQQIEDFEFEVYHNQDIKKLKFSDFQEKWLVLLFYPADFTFVCPTELEEAADKYEEFKHVGAEILSVSTDTVYVHKAWHDQSPAIAKIKYPMVADPAAKLCRYFGTYLEDIGLSLRGSFIIDPNRVLKALEIHDNSIGRSADEILRKHEAAIFVYGH